MVYFADLIVLGNRIRQGCIELSSVHKSNGHACFADVDVADLLIGSPFSDGFF